MKSHERTYPARTQSAQYSIAIQHKLKQEARGAAVDRPRRTHGCHGGTMGLPHLGPLATDRVPYESAAKSPPSPPPKPPLSPPEYPPLS
mmetsp:Transcript_1452/g.3119  ORF Transcript_1452/g.3119 Transcript_1452/m.3119 type:complete len:89 (-) Transcript_1452:268-534(-)